MRAAPILLAAAAISGCGGGPNAPTPTLTAPVALSGQSNALFLSPILSAAYGPVVGASEGGLEIAFWAPDGRMWAALAPTLHQPVRAFIWWQGESDSPYSGAAYFAHLSDLMGRVRAEAGNPVLPVLLIRVTDAPELSEVRGAEAAWVAQDRHAQLLSCDDLPHRPGEYHLTEAGYQAMAQRVIRALP